MPISQYQAFGIGAGANTLPYSEYVTKTDLIGLGFQAGLAKSEEMNTVLRQVSVAVAALGQFIATYGSLDALDNGSVSGFVAALKSALDNVYTAPSLAGYVQRSEFTGANQDLSGPGFQRLPGGLILQWVSINVGDVPAGNDGFKQSFSYPVPVDELLFIGTSQRGNAIATSSYIDQETLSGARFNIHEWDPFAQANVVSNIYIIGRKA